VFLRITGKREDGYHDLASLQAAACSLVTDVHFLCYTSLMFANIDKSKV
jgi:4-diphosphocytidyl-2C-methyl-D-erythritol kinase